MHTYDLDRSKFEDVKVSTSLIVFRNRPPHGGEHVRVSIGGPPAHPAEADDISLDTLASLPKWTPARLAAPRPAKRVAPGVTLGELFVIRRGIATGSNADFVLNDADLRDLEIKSDWVRPVIPKARELVSNIVDANKRGNPRVKPRLWLIDTAAELEEIRRHSAGFATYLDEVWARVQDRTLVRQRHPFYKQEARTPPQFFVSYMARSATVSLRSRFFLNRSRAVVLNNYFGLYPKGALGELLRLGRVADTDVLDALAAIEASQIELEGRTYVSGLEKIEPRELARVRAATFDQLMES
jgi:hypothetical protein